MQQVGGGLIQSDESLVSPLDLHANTMQGMIISCLYHSQISVHFTMQGLLELPPPLSPHRPVVAWQTDAFGHASSTPAVLPPLHPATAALRRQLYLGVLCFVWLQSRLLQVLRSLGFTHVILNRLPEKVGLSFTVSKRDFCSQLPMQVKQDMKRGSFYSGLQFWDDMEFVWEGEGGRGGGACCACAVERLCKWKMVRLGAFTGVHDAQARQKRR